ncbi:hypothetical protein AB7849_15645 [Rhodanobacter sp. 115]|uniref:hypothetical protein n=1 Tax=Rhodanobacter sp. FW021-MT20 TaxID=1162282 RepID=UPI0034E3A35D
MAAASAQKSEVLTIDLTPTWGELGNVYTRMAESGERAAARGMRGEVARAFALAEAFKKIHEALPADLREQAEKIVAAELRKQGIEVLPVKEGEHA